MATKDKDPCRDNAAPGEPLFTLRAQDRLAPELVREWAAQALLAGAPHAKVDDAIRVAGDMEAWQVHNGSKVPD